MRHLRRRRRLSAWFSWVGAIAWVRKYRRKDRVMDPFKAVYFEAAQENQRRINTKVVPESGEQTGEVHVETTGPRFTATLRRIVTSTVAQPLHLVRGAAGN